MGTKLRKVGKAGLVFAGVLLILVVGLVVALHLPPVLDRIARFAEDAASSGLDGTLEIESLEGSLFGTLTANKLVLRGPDGERVVAAKSVDIELTLSALLSRTVSVDIEATGLAGYIERRKDGTVNLTDLFIESEEDTGLSPVALDIRVATPDGLIVWRDHTAPAEGDPLSEIKADFEMASLEDAVKLVPTPDNLARTTPHSALLRDLKLNLRVEVERDSTTRIGVATLQTDAVVPGVTGRRALSIEGVRVEIAAERTDLSLESLNIADWLKIDDARAWASSENIEDFGLHIQQLMLTDEVARFAGADLGLRSGVELELHASGRAQEDTAIWASVTPTAAKGRLVASGRINGWLTPGPDTTFDLTVSAENLDVSGVVAVAEPLNELSMWAKIEGKGVDPETMTATGRIAVRNADIGPYRVSAVYVKAAASDGGVRVDELLATSPYASANARGSLVANGRFGIDAVVHSTDAAASLSKQLLGTEVTSRADLRLNAVGKLDLSASAPLDILESVDADARWDINQFSMEDVRVEASRGDVAFSVAASDGDSRRVSWDVDGSARRVAVGEQTIGNAAVKSEGSTQISGSSVDARNVLGALRASVDLDVEAVDWGSGGIRDGHVLAKVAPAQGRLRYDLSVSTEALDMSALKVGAAAAQLEGSVKLGPTLDWPGAVSAVAARGSVSAREIDTGNQKAGQVTALVDVSGPLTDLGGAVDIQASSLAAGGFDFSTIDAKLAFTGDRYFTIDAQGVQKEKKPSNIGLVVRGRYTRDLTDYTILDLQLKTVGDAWEMEGEFTADTDAGVFTFQDVTLKRGEQRVRVDGEFRLGRDQNLEAELEKVDLGGLAEQFGLSALEPLAGIVSGSVKLGGTHKRPTAEFRFTFEGLMWEQIGPFAGVLAGSYDDALLRLETFDVSGYGSKLLEGTARVPIEVDMGGALDVQRGEAVRVRLTIPEQNLSELANHFESLSTASLSGIVRGELTVTGTLNNPILQGELKAEKVVTTGKTDGVEYSLGPAEAVLQLGYLPLRTSDAGLRVKASVSFQDEPPLHASARVNAPIADWVAESLEGSEIDWVQKFESAPWEFEVKAQRFDLRNLRFGALQAADVEGFVDLAVDGAGTLDAPRVEIDIGLDDFGWDRYRDVYVDLLGTVDRDRARIRRLTLEWDGDDILRAQGALPAPFSVVFGDAPLEALPLEFAVQLLPLPLKKFSAVDYTFAALKGEVAGFARLDGTLSAPVLDGRFSAVDVEFSDKSRGTVAIEFGTTGERANVDLLVCQGPTPILVGAASVPVRLNLVELIESDSYNPLGEGEMTASLLGNNVPLASLVPRKVLEDIVSGVAGAMSVDLKVSGTFEEPRLAGTLDVRDGEVFLPEYSRAFRDIQVDLEMSREGKLAIDRLHVGDVRGFADAKGEMQFDGLTPTLIDVDATLDSFGTAGFTDLPAFVSAQIEVDGDLSGAAANAEAVISKLEVIIPETSSTELHATELDPDIIIVRPGRSTRDDLFSTIVEAGPITSEPYARLRVVVERDSWIRHPFAEVEVEGDMRVELAGTGATLGGEVNTVRGVAEVFGRRFVLQEGIVTFTGANPPNPLLQIEAEYEYDPNVASALGAATQGKPHATVRVTGRVSNPSIRFYSDPDMPESDVIYTLLTNRAPSQADVGQGSAGSLAAGAASGIAANFLQDRLQDVLPVQFDVFRVEAGERGFADPTVEVGKYLFEDVFFSVEYRIGADQNENTSEFNIEYRFSPRWLFEFEAGNRGTGEANLFWDVY